MEVVQKDWDPIEIGSRFRIQFPFHKDDPNSDRTVLRLIGGNAFGTGDHPTTAMCLQYLEDHSKKRSFSDLDVLDYGSGSGVLGIAALLLGAKVGLDINERFHLL